MDLEHLPAEIEYLPADVQGYERASLRAMKVVGPSMNRMYAPGRYVILAPPEEAGLRVGDVVVVERRQGNQVEVTLKQLEYVDGAVELWPRSDHPDFQEPIRYNPRENDQDAPRIIGIVVGDYGRSARGDMPFILPKTHAE